MRSVVVAVGFVLVLVFACAPRKPPVRAFPPNDYDRAVAAYVLKTPGGKAYVSGRDCASAPSDDLRNLCERKCSSISDRRIKGLCSGNCSLIDMGTDHALYYYCSVSVRQYQGPCEMVDDPYMRERCEKLNATREVDPTPVYDEPGGGGNAGGGGGGDEGGGGEEKTCIPDGHDTGGSTGDCCSGCSRSNNNGGYNCCACGGQCG